MREKIDAFYWKVRGAVSAALATVSIPTSVLALFMGAVRVFAGGDEGTDPSAGTGGTSTTSTMDIGGLANTAVTQLSSGQEALVKIALAVLPIALIALLLVIMVNHDPRTLKTYLGAILTIIIAAVAILMVNSGAVLQLIGSMSGQDTTGYTAP